MSKNCIHCVVNRRTGIDLLCDECRAQKKVEKLSLTSGYLCRCCQCQREYQDPDKDRLICPECMAAAAKRNASTDVRTKRRADNGVSLYVVYFNPSDYPGKYVLREHIVGYGPCSLAIFHEQLDFVRQFIPRGPVRFDRAPDDDPAILEVWL